MVDTEWIRFINFEMPIRYMESFIILLPEDVFQSLFFCELPISYIYLYLKGTLSKYAYI